jgi:hypothetical protein
LRLGDTLTGFVPRSRALRGANMALWRRGAFSCINVLKREKRQMIYAVGVASPGRSTLPGCPLGWGLMDAKKLPRRRS